MKPSKTTAFVILSTILIAVCLSVSVRDINFIPADAKHLYVKSAAQLPNLNYISDIHESIEPYRIQWLHGKEGFVLCVSLMQRLFQDFKSLRPLILVDILGLCISALLVFFIGNAYWGKRAGLICYLVFITSFWPYLYVLFVKHQPMGLMFFLFSIFLLQKIHRHWFSQILYMASGAAFCFSIFTSNVSALYFPFYVAAFLYTFISPLFKRGVRGDLGEKFKYIFMPLAHAGSLCLAGFISVLVYFNYPNIIQNLTEYFEYVNTSATFNHFRYNRPILVEWIPEGISPRGGWLWIFRFFMAVMPVLFPVYLASIFYLLIRCFKAGIKNKAFILKTIGFILLSLSSPILAEVRGVAQYGANYFTSFIGFIMLLGYTAAVMDFSQLKVKAAIIKYIFIIIFIFHVGINGYVFFSDVYPSRMATSFLSRKIESLDIKEIHTYQKHPSRTFMVDYLSPNVLSKIKFLPIENINQPKEGYILLPPVTTDYLYEMIMSYVDYSKDIYVNELMKKGKLEDYAVGAYPTLASSRIWSFEEETIAYRCLMLNQYSKDKVRKGTLWLLDAAKLRKDMEKNFPRKEYFQMVLQGIRNIGTKTRLYYYNGVLVDISKSKLAKSLPLRIYKVGQPADRLVTYVYKRDEKDPGLWLPYGEHFTSLPVDAKDITSDEKGEIVNFKFPKPLSLDRGLYIFVTYRKGKPSDEHYYRVYMDNAHSTAKNIQSIVIPGYDMRELINKLSL